MAVNETTVNQTLEEITERFASGFPKEVPALRTVGREAEFPLVNPDGSAADVLTLWPALLERADCRPIYDRAVDGSEFLVGVEADSWSCVTEVGKGTLEISVGPRATLHELARDMEDGLARLKEVVRTSGVRLLGFGIQPKTPASVGLLTPKRRYHALLETIGAGWLKFCVTAADQVQIDMGKDEIVRLANLINAASGVIIAVTANSSVYGGRAGRFASGREGLTANMVGEPDRHGSSPRPFADLEEYLQFLAGLKCLCLPDGNGEYRVVGLPFTEYLRQRPLDKDIQETYEEFLFHEHYIWPSARPRSRIGTLEVRPSCQQPAGSGWVPSALALGLVESAAEAQSFLEDALGTNYWSGLRWYRKEAVEQGLGASEPIPDFLETVLDIARQGLQRRGRDEELFLAPAFEMLERRVGHSARARKSVEEGGINALVEELSLT